MFNKKLLGILGILLLFSAIYLNQSDIKEQYLFFFKKSGIIVHNNGEKKFEVDSVINGYLRTKATFSNGLQEGWFFKYYKSGMVKNKSFFKRNQANGPEYEYYENGKLKYVANNIDNKWIGDVHWYTENSKLDSYATFNIKGKSFCLFQYDKSGKITDMKGLVVSPDIYSINSRDSVIVLDFNRDRGYNEIKDLYIVVATPPHLHLQVIVNINNTQFKDLPINSNIITVPNAFINKGNYKIFIESHLYDKNNNIVNGINIETKITKE
jgi:hypothetical protein